VVKTETDTDLRIV